MNHDLINQVESLKIMMVSRARGELLDDPHYQKIRLELLTVPRIVKVLPQCVHTCRSLPEFWGFIQPKFKSYADRTQFIRSQFEPVLAMLESEDRSPSDALISATVKAVNLEFIQEAWHKALERRASDPEGAITIARSLLESVCKHVLDSCGVVYPHAADLPNLYSEGAKQLNLSPSQHTEQLFKQILGGCHSVVQGLGSLRNRHSDAHGKGAAGTRPAPRHAELAVNLSGAMATFLLQTWETTKTNA
jgi:hypothetical protein